MQLGLVGARNQAEDKEIRESSLKAMKGLGRRPVHIKPEMILILLSLEKLG